MNGCFVGAMPVSAFFYPFAPATEELSPDLPDNTFAGVPIDGAGSALYDLFASTRLIG